MWIVRIRKVSERNTCYCFGCSNVCTGFEIGFGNRATVSAWTNSLDVNEVVYDFDTRGDKDNLAFGGLYRADVAAYKRYGRGVKQWRARGAGQESAQTFQWRKGGGLEAVNQQDARYVSVLLVFESKVTPSV